TQSIYSTVSKSERPEANTITESSEITTINKDCETAVISKKHRTNELWDDKLMQGYDRFLEDNQVNAINNKNKFERYLNDLFVPCSETFDVLVWWKKNELKYPSMLSMVRDIFAIPITSVASKSVILVLAKFLH
ncbi:14873_t:CDS:2, partial [Cetraspora pellucida]